MERCAFSLRPDWGWRSFAWILGRGCKVEASARVEGQGAEGTGGGSGRRDASEGDGTIQDRGTGRDGRACKKKEDCSDGEANTAGESADSSSLSSRSRTRSRTCVLAHRGHHKRTWSAISRRCLVGRGWELSHTFNAQMHI